MREHNNANILSLGAQFVIEDEAREAVKKFLENAVFRLSASRAPSREVLK